MCAESANALLFFSNFDKNSKVRLFIVFKNSTEWKKLKCWWILITNPCVKILNDVYDNRWNTWKFRIPGFVCHNTKSWFCDPTITKDLMSTVLRTIRMCIVVDCRGRCVPTYWRRQKEQLGRGGRGAGRHGGQWPRGTNWKPAELGTSYRCKSRYRYCLKYGLRQL